MDLISLVICVIVGGLTGWFIPRLRKLNRPRGLKVDVVAAMLGALTVYAITYQGVSGIIPVLALFSHIGAIAALAAVRGDGSTTLEI